MSEEERERRRRAWEERREERRRRRHEHRRERKERILHTRISEELAEDIRRVAEDLRVPVSNLVRNVLDEAFSAVEIVSENVGDLVEDIIDEAEHAQRRMRRRRRHRAGRHGPRDREADIVDVDAEEARGAPGGTAPAAAAEPGTPPAPGEDAEPAASSAPFERGDDRREGAGGPARPEFPDVLGWQPVLLNRDLTCADCERTIPPGKRAFLGLTAGGPASIALCRRCMNARG